MPDVSCNYCKTANQCYSPNPEVSVAQRRPLALQLCSHLSITTCSSPVKGQRGKIWRKYPVQPFKEGVCTFPQSVGPVEQLPQRDARRKLVLGRYGRQLGNQCCRGNPFEEVAQNIRVQEVPQASSSTGRPASFSRPAYISSIRDSKSSSSTSLQAPARARAP